ncbi:MAG TPA: hypothetical protein VGI45_09410 [Terracidiphilus sp.]|jgi:hypothetical protein
MKRLIQIFAVTLIGLLTAGPAWAAVSCALDNSAMGASCPMGMAHMDADCPMSHAMAMMDCSQDCCNRTLPQALVLPGIPLKSKILAPAQGMFTLSVAQTTETRANSEPVSPRVSTSPPRYLLLRVFRI